MIPLLSDDWDVNPYADFYSAKFEPLPGVNMSYIRDQKIGAETLEKSFGTIDSGLLEHIEDEISRKMWAWLESAPETKVLSVKVWFFSVTIRRKDLRPLWLILFGAVPNP